MPNAGRQFRSERSISRYESQFLVVEGISVFRKTKVFERRLKIILPRLVSDEMNHSGQN